MTQYIGEHQIRDALRSRSGPDVTDIDKAPLGPHVLIYRVCRHERDGNYSVINRRDETCTEPDKGGLKEFHTTVVKPYYYTPQPKMTMQSFKIFFKAVLKLQTPADPQRPKLVWFSAKHP